MPTEEFRPSKTWTQAQDPLRQEAELAYDQFRSEKDQYPGADFSLFCRQHPRLAPSLKRIDLEWQSIDGLADELRLKFGGGLREDSLEDYVIEDNIGSGGMGEVHLATQQRPIARRVAIKLIKMGMDTQEVLSRFEAERQALARMSHPSVAQVYDAGITREGRPYFVMEYVDGEPLTTFVHRHRLPLHDRISLFVQLCHGIQHAHQKGLIHRDIKPSNVLAYFDEQGRPHCKVIDFGIAKATEERLTERTFQTRSGCVLGTPAYMSPEQAGLGEEDIDTRTDVYSLGVVLYELLAGVRPYEGTAKSLSEFHDLLRRIRDEDPPLPSTHLRQSSPDNLAFRDVRGDLDWITMKAIARSKENRYPTAAQLAADVIRYQKHEPVVAGPPSKVYRIKRLARRHRIGFLGASAVLLSLLGGLGTSLYLYKSMRTERDAAVLARKEADHRSADVRHLARTFVFDLHERLANLPGTLETREYIYKTAIHYLDGLQKEAEVDESLRWDLVTAYVRVADILGEVGNKHRGDSRMAYQNALKAHELMAPAMSPAPKDLSHELAFVKNLLRLGDLEDVLGRPEDSRQWFEKAWAHSKRLPPLDQSLHHIQMILHERLGDLDLRAKHHEESLAHFQRFLDLAELSGDARDRYLANAKVGSALEALGRLEDALSHHRESHRLAKGRHQQSPHEHGYRPFDLASSLSHVGDVLFRMNRFAEALETYQESLKILRPAYEQDPQNADAYQALAVAYGRIGEAMSQSDSHDSAFEHLEKALEIFDSLVERDPHNGHWVKNLCEQFMILGEAYVRAEREEEAYSPLEGALWLSEQWTRSHPDDAWAKWLMKNAEKALDQLDEADSSP